MSIILILEIFETDMNIRALSYYVTPTQYEIYESSMGLHVGVVWIDEKIIGQVTSNPWISWLLARRWGKLVTKQLSNAHIRITIPLMLTSSYVGCMKLISRIQRSSLVPWCCFLHWMYKVYGNCESYNPEKVLWQFGRMQIIPRSPIPPSHCRRGYSAK